MEKKNHVSKQVEKLLEEHPEEVIRAILEKPFWPPEARTNVGYRRFGDDNNSTLTVSFSNDSDGWIEVFEHKDPEEPMYGLRFRTFFGGGQSERTRNALLILARAIALDNKDRPQHRRTRE